MPPLGMIIPTDTSMKKAKLLLIMNGILVKSEDVSVMLYTEMLIAHHVCVRTVQMFLIPVIIC